MHVKRIYRPTVREALMAARDLLGPSALVLSTELVPAPGWRGWIGQRIVRLTAATERPDDQPTEAGPPGEVSARRTSVTNDRHLALTGLQSGVAARLAATGLSRSFAEAVAVRLTPGECRGGSETGLRRALVAEVAESGCAPLMPLSFSRYEVFVGPPGVGKTTTIAKLAARERAAGRTTLGLVAADGFRAGAVEQLRSYAAVMGVPLRVARTADELDRALEAMRHPALIDTAGRSPGDAALTDVLAALDRRRHVRRHLVLPADASPAAARRILARYAAVRPSHVVVTRLDESDSLVPLFNVLRDEGLPVSYLTNGQRVPDDLQPATAATLAAALTMDPSERAA